MLGTAGGTPQAAGNSTFLEAWDMLQENLPAHECCGVMPNLPDELTITLLKDQWKPAADEEYHRRRSIYIFARRNLRFPIFEAFDRPDINASCAARNQTTIAPQALFLLNSEFSLASARDLAEFVRDQAGDDSSAQIDLLYCRTLGREPTATQKTRAQSFLQERANASGDPLALLCLAVFNSNEFVYVD